MNPSIPTVGFEVPAAATGVPASACALHDAVGDTLLEGNERFGVSKIPSKIGSIWSYLGGLLKCILLNVF